jgi:hypothetical protein
MPNHITNIIECDATTDLDLVKAALAGDELVDFNAVIPKPEGFKETQTHCGLIDKARAMVGIGFEKSICGAYSGLEKSNFDRAVAEPLKSIDEIDLIADMARNYMLTGYIYWYDWNVANWGTKWGAYSIEVSDERIKFKTAWSHPHVVMKALSEKLPSVRLKLKYADEDTGSNCGSYELLNGIASNEHISPGWRHMDGAEKYKWVTFALSLTDPDSTPEQHGYSTNGEYSEDLYLTHNPD